MCPYIAGQSEWVYTAHSELHCVSRALHQGKAICLWTAPSGEIYHHCTWPLIMTMDSPLVYLLVHVCVALCMWHPPMSASLLKCCRGGAAIGLSWLHPWQVLILIHWTGTNTQNTINWGRHQRRREIRIRSFSSTFAFGQQVAAK